MSHQSEINVIIETEKTLNNIQDITQKIIRELTMINEMIRDKGNLSVAQEEANVALIRIAQEQGVKSIDELLTLDNNEEDLLNPTTLDGITQKLMAIMDT